jgi:hypothetical protein
MGNWYFVVGLFIAGFTWHALYYSNLFTGKDRDIFPFVIAWAMIAIWGLVLALAVVAIPVILGIYAAKVLNSRLD